MPLEKIIQSSEMAQSYMLSIIDDIHQNGPVNAVNLEFLAYIKHFYPEEFKKHENLLLQEMGLFYKPLKVTSLKEKIYSLYADAIREKTGYAYTPVQAHMNSKISKNKYFSFSAPTSSGKSYLFMQLIKNCKKDIVIVVPSRALIAEYFHKVLKIVEDDNSILVLQFIENINKKHTKRRIFIVTPERGKELFAFSSDFEIEMFLFDEAQISEEPIRGMKFDTFVRRTEKIFPDAKKIFAHPFINNPEAQLYRNNLKTVDMPAKVYNQYSVGKIYMSYVSTINTFFYAPPLGLRRKLWNRATKFDPIYRTLSNNGTVLIYTSKKSIYSHEYLHKYKKYTDMCPRISDNNALDIINQLKEYIGSSKECPSKLIEMMERGIVIHHGSIPLKGRLLLENFINAGYARICFSTSTLLQGINMPFDVVWIDNYRFGDSDKDILALKNLVGRAGRSSTNNEYNYGYVVINDSSRRSFFRRIRKNVLISDKSLIETTDLNSIDEDLQDTVAAVINNTFDDDLQITTSQKERLEKPEIVPYIEFVLEKLINEDNEAITAEQYYEIDKVERQKLKDSFKAIFCQHLKRTEISSNEERILSACLPILLWRIQGRSFRQIVAFRYLYITKYKERSAIRKRFEEGEISLEEFKNAELNIELIKTPQAVPLPDRNAAYRPLYEDFHAKYKDFDYDLLVYDTYDYIDKVISLSLCNPISAAFQIYYQKTKNIKALTLSNYVRYGTNDNKEILLLKYGFNFEEIEWLKDFVVSVNEDEIIFSENISELPTDKYETIKKYIY